MVALWVKVVAVMAALEGVVVQVIPPGVLALLVKVMLVEHLIIHIHRLAVVAVEQLPLVQMLLVAQGVMVELVQIKQLLVHQ